MNIVPKGTTIRIGNRPGLLKSAIDIVFTLESDSYKIRNGLFTCKNAKVIYDPNGWGDTITHNFNPVYDEIIDTSKSTNHIFKNSLKKLQGGLFR